MSLKNLNVGFAVTGSFCTFAKIIPVIKQLLDEGADVHPIVSETVNSTDTRFGTAKDFMNKLVELTGKKVISSIVDAEPIGPKSLLDVLVIAPCTGNTLAKIANGISDSAVTMACKAQLRNQRPVIIAISTNDGLSGNAQNIGIVLNRKNIYMVPFGQDDPKNKQNSLVADYSKIIPTILHALEGRQIHPILI
ncbi:MAG TPA: dipicolinate synthase subunit B [Clostridiaceae bacterium]|jgi:dipicolinate synthase subunit B|nr:dipicolinate synthase subunit B [Clostridiaceae bacterium]